MGQHVPKARNPTTIGTRRRPARSVPTPPVDLDESVTTWWTTLWRTPVAAIWTVSDHAAVLTLARLLAALEVEVTPGVAGQATNIATQLGLSPRSRATLRIETEAQPERPATGREQFRPGGERDPERVVSLDQRRISK